MHNSRYYLYMEKFQIPPYLTATKARIRISLNNNNMEVFKIQF